MNFRILHYDTLRSTNTEALNQAKLGASEGLCVIARRQTAGRGRQGREWISEQDAGLYFSIVLRPRIDPRFIPLLTLMAGIAVHDTLTEFGLRPDIKWVNDVLVDERKISGILAETIETDAGQAVIVGIGVNLRSANFPAEIADTATSIEQSTGKLVSAAELTERLLVHLERFHELAHRVDGPAAIVDEWSKRSSYFSGKRVRVSTGSAVITGLTDGLEANGALRVVKDDGRLAIIQAGDVERLRAPAD